MLELYDGQDLNCKSESSKSIPSLPCPECEVLFNQENPRLCKGCEHYVNQDYVPQRETCFSESFLEELACLNPDANDYSDDSQLPYLEDFISLAKLSERQAEVLRLYFQDGKKTGEIADQLGLSKETVKEHYERAVKKLRACPKISLLLKENGKQKAKPTSQRSTSLNNFEKPGPVKIYVPGEDGVLLLKKTVEPPTTPQGTYQECPRCCSQILREDCISLECASYAWRSDD